MSNLASIALQSEIKRSLEWMEQNIGPMPEGAKLNLGCGRMKLPANEGWINVDANPAMEPEKTLNLDLINWGLVFHKDHFEFCVISHLIEHIKDLVAFMQGIHYCMKEGAKVFIVAPYAWSNAAVEDPTHCRYITENSFSVFDRGTLHKQAAHGYEFDCDFKHIQVAFVPTVKYRGIKDPEELMRLKETRINIVRDVQILLETVKPVREVRETP